MTKSKGIPVYFLFLALLGIADSTFLTLKHFSLLTTGTCGVGPFSGCGPVLTSSYSEIFGIPVALMGLGYYLFIFFSLILLRRKNHTGLIKLMIAASTGAFFFSLYLMSLQFFVIRSICIYCSFSALVSTILFLLIQKRFHFERKTFSTNTVHFLYKYPLRPIIFLTKSDTIHELALDFGKLLGQIPGINKVLSYFFVFKDESLEQNIAGISFPNPIGMAAGFDYEAKLTQITPSIGFGFQSVGTITNSPYAGNPPPMLGRLPKSKSLMVNKGFKNAGAVNTIKSLKNKDFDIPIGISVGRTNSLKLNTQKKSITDIIKTFKLFEKSGIRNSYYELNISCPNLSGCIEFYTPKNLESLLKAVDKLEIKKPVFVKMPISKSDKEILAMLSVIAKHKITGVILGNLQTDRNHPTLVKSEVKKFEKGYFSGKPTYNRSNELISLTSKKYKKRFVIIGCGGVFTGQDAFEKIRRGANLVQFITGLIYEGPQTAAKINQELYGIIRKKGFKNISRAVGSFRK